MAASAWTPVEESTNASAWTPVQESISASAQPDIAHQPASLSGVVKTLGTKEGLSAAVDPLVGFVKGAGDTVHGVGELVRKGLNRVSAGAGDKVVPPVGQAALEKDSESDNGAQTTGKALENVAEFLTGEGAVDEAGKALSLSEKAQKLGTVAKFLDQHPFVAKMLASATKGGIVGGSQAATKSGGNPTATAEGAAAGAVGNATVDAATSAAGHIRDLYKPLAKNTSLQDIQPILQKGIRDTLGDTATTAGVKAPAAQSVRDVVADTAEQVKAKSQPVFQKLDDLSGGKLSDLQAQANRYRNALDKAGKDAYDKALSDQDALFAKYQDKFDSKAFEQAKTDWKQYRALQEVDDAVKSSTVGQRPEVASGSANKQPTEQVNPKMLMNRLNRLYNEGTLQTAVGKNQAHALLDHAGAAQSRAEDIAYNVRQANAKQIAGRKTVRNVAVGVAAGAGAAAIKNEAVRKVLSGQ